MDEMKIGSKFMRRILAGIIEKTIHEKTGMKVSVQFNEPVQVSYDETNDIFAHLNVDLLPREDVERLIEELI